MDQPSCCTPSRLAKETKETTAISAQWPSDGAHAHKAPVGDNEMVYVPGGEFLMGTEDREGFARDGEGPVRRVVLPPFWIDACTVTNAQFLAFVKATGYQTEAERFGASFVFGQFVSPKTAQTVQQVVQHTPWWWLVEGADFAHPEGPDSDLAGREKHPVVHISWHDAKAYAAWAGKRLPTEAEWECAARGGLVQKRFAWGDELHPDGKHMCNIWQGKFPDVNHASDGYFGAAPADAYAPNGYGLYNVCGNVWEWCEDWFSADYHLKSTHRNPKGPHRGTAKVTRGGSYLCHKSYCNRYRVAARSSNTPESSTGNIGFRCVRDA
ncbi:MAG: formylglycine-generating enzyme family protein [Firmicutes bacterium]|nr:formylglycine-generating enzyme family protein [Bacillota bacterium]